MLLRDRVIIECRGGAVGAEFVAGGTSVSEVEAFWGCGATCYVSTSRLSLCACDIVVDGDDEHCGEVAELVGKLSIVVDDECTSGGGGCMMVWG